MYFILDPRSDPSGKRPKRNRHLRIEIWIGIILGVLLLLALAVVLFFVIRHRLENNKESSRTAAPIPPARSNRNNEP